MNQKLLTDFIVSPLYTIAIWQSRRTVWFIIGGIALVLELLAWGVFQEILGYQPCELCVYIRLSMFIIFIGAMVACINPQSLLLRTIGAYNIAGYGIIKGFNWNMKLEMQYLMVERIEDGGDIFAAGIGTGGCSTEPTFPFDLPLEQWFPSIFQPTGVCGADAWSLFGFNMSECLFLFYGVYTVLYMLSVASSIKYRI